MDKAKWKKGLQCIHAWISLCKVKLGALPLSFGCVLAVLCMYDEVLFQCWTVNLPSVPKLLPPVLFAGAAGMLLGLPIELMRREKAKRWILAVLGTLLAAAYLIEFYCLDAFHMLMAPALLLRGAKGIATDYTDIVVSLLTRELWRLALVLAPIWLGAFLLKPMHCEKKHLVGMWAGVLTAFVAGEGALLAVNGDLGPLMPNHDFEGAIHSLGVPAAMVQNVAVDLTGTQPELTLEVLPEPSKPVSAAPAQTQPEEQPEDEHKYAPNVLNVDYASLSRNYENINNYILAQEPTNQNEYTGIFKGKNLILITAEAFTAEVIDEERTPTLYRLANQGIRFTEYYQPAWGGSTTGGEMSNLFAVVPDCSGGMFQITNQHPFITMGYQLGKQDYFSMAFHNNTGGFYDRIGTHINLGYDEFITPDNGMQVKGCWPQSDLEMMVDTVPRYIDHQPFNIYYMTVSGHSVYDVSRNAMSAKNYDAVKDLPYSEPVKCYLAANQELEYAMAELVSQLEKAGIADDTVIVISPDHYPYGLDESRTWGNSKNCLAELFGVDNVTDTVRDHSALIIWSGCLEGKNITVDAPVSSLDLLPTLSNLFGLEYESRMFIGRDVFSDREPLVLWPNRSWVNEKGTYLSATETFIPRGEETVDEAYLKWMNSSIINKINFSYALQRQGYYAYLDKVMKSQE